MRTLRVINCLCLLLSIGYTLRVPLPECLKQLFDDSETERQSSAAATSPEAIVSAFVGTFLYSFVRSLLVLHEQHVLNTAAAETLALIQKTKAEIEALEDKKTAVSRIDDKIHEVTSTTRHQPLYTHSCSQFTVLCQAGLTAVIKEEDSSDALTAEILGASVKPCSVQEVITIQTVAAEAAKIIQELTKKIETKQEILQSLENKLASLTGTTTTQITSSTTSIIHTAETTTASYYGSKNEV